MNLHKQILLTFAAFFVVNFLFGQKLVKIWETGHELNIPESVLYDHESGNIFVSNIVGNPSEKDRKGFISILNNKGDIVDLQWIDGLNAPKGMGIFKRKLFVSDIDELIEIDLETRKIVKRYQVNGAQFLNDVAVCKNGMVFVSDSSTGKIHVLKDGKIESFNHLPIERCNGLFTYNGKLVVGGEQILEFNINTRDKRLLFNEGGGVDGIEKMPNGNFIFSHWAGRIFVTKGDQIIKLLDSTTENINTADIDYAEELELLLVPTFRDNRVVAYKIIW